MSAIDYRKAGKGVGEGSMSKKPTEWQFRHQDKMLGRLFSLQSEVTAYWRNHPEQRMGQAIVNALGLERDHRYVRLSNMSDEELHKVMTKMLLLGEERES